MDDCCWNKLHTDEWDSDVMICMILEAWSCLSVVKLIFSICYSLVLFSLHIISRMSYCLLVEIFYVFLDCFDFYPVQFYDKFNIRHNIAELLEYLWQVPSHRNAWRQVVILEMYRIIYCMISAYHLFPTLYICWLYFCCFRLLRKRRRASIWIS